MDRKAARPGAAGGGLRTAEYLRRLGVPVLAPATTPFDPGYDPLTVEAHLAQSGHLMAGLKVSMACWLVADEEATQRKVAAARRHAVRTVTGGGPFEIAADAGELPAYLDLCAELGFDAVEAGEGFTELSVSPEVVGGLVRERGLGLEFELGKKHERPFDDGSLDELIEVGRRWLAAGAEALVVEGRESGRDVGLFDELGRLRPRHAERLVAAFGLSTVVFEAPTKASQFALMDHFGSEVRLSNVRLEEVLRVEIYRRGLHADAFGRASWRAATVGSGV